MPDPTLDDLTRDWKVVRAAPPRQFRLDAAEQERLDALATPWPTKARDYLLWLTDHMPEPAGDILFVTTLFAVSTGTIAAIVGFFLLAMSHASWLAWFLLGAGMGKFALWLLRSAAATELRYRRSTAEKLAHQRDD